MILLSFNIINPEISEKNKSIVSDEELLKITSDGTYKILDILEENLCLATFFIEISIVEKLPNLLIDIIKKGHELALLNKNSYQKEIETAKKYAEEISQKSIKGIRQFPEKRLSSIYLREMKFIYRSPMDFSKIIFFKNPLQKKTAYEENEMMVIPESISQYSRLPYNDFTFQMIPLKFYQNMINETLLNNEYVVIYVNSWQFTELNHSKFGLPFYRKYNLGREMENKLSRFLKYIEDNEIAVSRMKDFFF